MGVLKKVKTAHFIIGGLPDTYISVKEVGEILGCSSERAFEEILRRMGGRVHWRSEDDQCCTGRDFLHCKKPVNYDEVYVPATVERFLFSPAKIFTPRVCRQREEHL